MLITLYWDAAFIKREENLIESHRKFWMINFMPSKLLEISDDYKK